MKRTILILSAVVALLASLGGCTKVKVECMFEIIPYRVSAADAERVLADNILIHAFYADTAAWRVASYDDALAGQITSKTDGSTQSPTFSAEQSDDGWVYLGPMTSVNLILVACDRTNRIYAWRAAQAGENVPSVQINVTFSPYKTEGEYTESKWTIINETPPSPEPPEPPEEPEE
jgi:hypothetical protein